MDDKKLNVSINDGGAFYTHEASINYSPIQFIFDFRCITPRIDPRSNEAPTLNIMHNVVIADVWHAKKIHELLGQMIEKYEKDFGKIEQPKVFKIVEKKMQKDSQKKETETEVNYFG